VRTSTIVVCALAVTRCSTPFWTPREGPLPSHDSRREVLGFWRLSFRTDTIDSVVYDPHGVERISRRGYRNEVVGTVQFLDSLTKDRGAIFARIDDSIAGFLCYRQLLIKVGVHRKDDEMELVSPNTFVADTRWDINLFANGRYYGDSVIGRWHQQCSESERRLGTFRMTRETKSTRLPNKRLEPAPPFSRGRIVFVNTRMLRRGSAAGR